MYVIYLFLALSPHPPRMLALENGDLIPLECCWVPAAFFSGLAPTQWSHSYFSTTKLQAELNPHKHSYVEVLTPRALDWNYVGGEGLKEVIKLT